VEYVVQIRQQQNSNDSIKVTMSNKLPLERVRKEGYTEWTQIQEEYLRTKENGKGFVTS
jgi:hypothetical protein